MIMRAGSIPLWFLVVFFFQKNIMLVGTWGWQLRLRPCTGAVVHGEGGLTARNVPREALDCCNHRSHALEGGILS